MSAKVCLRCDWSGATSSETCPRCGATLQGDAPRRSAGRQTERDAPEEAKLERSRWSVVATVVVLVLGVAAVAVVQRNTPAIQPSTPGSELGYLVYAAYDAGSPRLWVWNLSAATAAPGPRLRAIPTDLSFTYARSSGWVSASVPSTGRLDVLDAIVLRSLGAETVSEPLGRGELIAWLPSGGYLSIASTMGLGGCRRQLLVNSSNVSLDVSRRSLNREVCGHPTMLGRDLTTSYLTIERRRRASVYRVNDRRLVPVLRGYRALSVSLNGDLLVRRPQGHDLFYYYPSSVSDPPTSVTGSGDPLVVERVLGWSNDASAAYVLGSIRNVRGIFRITVSPEVEPRGPTLVLRTDAQDVSASTTPLGDVYASHDGEVTFVDDGAPRPLTRPIGAPPVTGPLLWISTLPYSPSVAG